MNKKVQDGQIVHSLAQACARGGHCLEDIPALVVAIIKDEGWKNFVVEESGKEVSYTKFEDFVSADVPDGLATTMKTLENLCNDNEEAISLLTLITKKPRGRPKKVKEPEPIVVEEIEEQEITEEIFVEPEEVVEAEEIKEEVSQPPKATPQPKNGSNRTIKTPRPVGTTRAKGHRRLESQRPDLHKKVLDGEITVHKACLEAGFRKKVFSISGEPASAARTIAKNYSPDDIKLLIEELKTLL